MTGLEAETIIDGNRIFEEFKGAITEQYVLQQFKTIKDLPIMYWSNETSRAEVDFVIQLKSNVVPVEVKAEKNLQANCLNSFEVINYVNLTLIVNKCNNFHEKIKVFQKNADKYKVSYME